MWHIPEWCQRNTQLIGEHDLVAYRRDGGRVEGEGWSRGVEEGC
jgi:hypothetical protein